MKNKIFMTAITISLVVVLALQVSTMVKLNRHIAMENKDDEDISADVDISVVNFDTPYGMLQYSSEWLDQIGIEKKEENGVYSVIYSSMMNGKKCELFTVTFGGVDEENFIGNTEYNGDLVPVAVKMASVDKSAWTIEEYTTICEMQKEADRVKSILD